MKRYGSLVFAAGKKRDGIAAAAGRSGCSAFFASRTPEMVTNRHEKELNNKKNK